jgi:predicted ArsR family transcriptional regulator
MNRHPLNAEKKAIVEMIRTLGECTVTDLHARIDLPLEMLKNRLSYLQESGHIHVADWTHDDHGRPLRVFRAGEGESITRAQHAFMLARARACERMKLEAPQRTVVVPRPDIAAAWLMP